MNGGALASRWWSSPGPNGRTVAPAANNPYAVSWLLNAFSDPAADVGGTMGGHPLQSADPSPRGLRPFPPQRSAHPWLKRTRLGNTGPPQPHLAAVFATGDSNAPRPTSRAPDARRDR
jgi:hypothetical protein